MVITMTGKSVLMQHGYIASLNYLCTCVEVQQCTVHSENPVEKV